MLKDIKEIQDKIKSEKIKDLKDLESFRIKYLGKKGFISECYQLLAKANKEEKKEIGQKTNQIKLLIQNILNEKKEELTEDKIEEIDITLPGKKKEIGKSHILTQTIKEICEIFQRLGFVIQEGPEIETEFYNFDALNIPKNHPSRDGFDTFFLNTKTEEGENYLLRSHTSPGQIRVMKENDPPLAVIIPGKVYRPDAVDASHSFMFHQIEGLFVNTKTSFAELKGLLYQFCEEFFNGGIKMRLRPHYFPFTEPSAEVDIFWEKGKKDWLEIMGCGMVHPKVFECVNYEKNKFQGFAFGLGVERMTMLKYGITDIRLFYDNHKQFIKQF